MSKWQEDGVCPECRKRKELFIIVPLSWVDIKTGTAVNLLDNNPRVTVECQKCKALFHWYPATGKITRTKFQSGTGRK